MQDDLKRPATIATSPGKVENSTNYNQNIVVQVYLRREFTQTSRK
jgi:hypothetical protein